MHIIQCERCPTYKDVEDDVVGWVCGVCACIGAAQVQLAEEDRLSRYTREQSKAARKEHGWTQRDLAFKLDISICDISAFERKKDPELIHPTHAEWLDTQ